MKIPVFVSCPSDLNEIQNKSRELILNELEDQQLEPRALGRSDYPAEFPLREVYSIAKRSAGGVILGFSQFEASAGVWKRGTSKKAALEKPKAFPSPWNNLEAGILFGLKLPILIFHEPDISGGIFDVGTSDLFVHVMPTPKISKVEKNALRQVFLKWASKVRHQYYCDDF